MKAGDFVDELTDGSVRYGHIGGDGTGSAQVRSFGYVTVDDTSNASSYFGYDRQHSWEDVIKMFGTKLSVAPKEGVEMQGLFEVYLVYGESRKEPVVHSARVVATSEEEAKLKSGLYPLIQKDWDPDFVTLFVRKLGDVAVKERAKEVRQV